MKKKILNLMLAAAMLCAFIPCAAHAEEWENYTYEINSDGKGVTITGFEDLEETSVVIPDTIAGLPVTQIGYAAFLRSRNLKNIIIPDSVTFIGGSASISPDTTGGDTVKFFVWSNYFQPLTQTEIQTVGE